MAHPSSLEAEQVVIQLINDNDFKLTCMMNEFNGVSNVRGSESGWGRRDRHRRLLVWLSALQVTSQIIIINKRTVRTLLYTYYTL